MDAKNKPLHPEQIVARCKVCTKKIRACEEHCQVYHAGVYHLVCCASCAAKFEANPQQYLEEL